MSRPTSRLGTDLIITFEIKPIIHYFKVFIEEGDKSRSGLISNLKDSSQWV